MSDVSQHVAEVRLHARMRCIRREAIDSGCLCVCVRLGGVALHPRMGSCASVMVAPSVIQRTHAVQK